MDLRSRTRIFFFGLGSALYVRSVGFYNPTGVVALCLITQEMD